VASDAARKRVEGLSVKSDRIAHGVRAFARSLVESGRLALSDFETLDQLLISEMEKQADAVVFLWECRAKGMSRPQAIGAAYRKFESIVENKIALLNQLKHPGGDVLPLAKEKREARFAPVLTSPKISD
jgi:hypothetical protein